MYFAFFCRGDHTSWLCECCQLPRLGSVGDPHARHTCKMHLDKGKMFCMFKTICFFFVPGPIGESVAGMAGCPSPVASDTWGLSRASVSRLKNMPCKATGAARSLLCGLQILYILCYTIIYYIDILYIYICYIYYMYYIYTIYSIYTIYVLYILYIHICHIYYVCYIHYIHHI